MSPAAPPVLEVDLGPGVRAAFTTVGSVPRATDTPATAFNLSLVLGDDAATVVTRRLRLREWVGAPVAFARQVHGATVRVCGPADVGSPGDLPAREADALVAVGGAVAVGVLVADCVPVLLAAPDVGAVGAVHAGRRGVVAGVVPAAIGTLIRLGAQPGRIRAVVGPAICGACYEVPADLQHEVDAAVPGAASTTSWGTPSLDLPGAVGRQLIAAGLGDVKRLDACTFTDTRWFSHRASATAGRPVGRFAAVVSWLPPAGGRVAAAG